MTLQNIFFDLDGTLMDPKKGIVKSIQYALQKLNTPVPESDELTWCIGPPLLTSFEKLLGEDTDLAETALSLYRERFGVKGKYENKVYPDIPETLKRLKGQGKRLYVATSKPTVFSDDIVKHFGLSEYFIKVYGSELSGEFSEKGDLIAHILKTEHQTTRQTVMVGDRHYDAVGAKRCDVYSLGHRTV